MRAQQLLKLKDLPFFSDMKSENLEKLLEGALLQKFPPGVILVTEGDSADFLHVLVDGLVEIFTEQTSGASGISLIRPVSTFILAAVINDLPYLNSARTLTGSSILLIPAQGVRNLFDEDVAFARFVARELALAYRSLSKKLKSHMTRSSAERIANWILTECDQATNIGRVFVPFDRATLASHIGTTRENLSRNLATLTDHGVRVRGREIIIEDRELLQALAQPQRLIDDPAS